MTQQTYRILLPVFEGPMDLLLYLIKKDELDITDIPIALVTEKYLEYLNLMREMNVTIASEFLVMAATLMFIKSKMLLPQPEEEREETPIEDPRAPLMQQLMEHQQFKEIAFYLEEKATLEENVFSRWLPLEILEGEAYEEIESMDLYTLFKLFSQITKEIGERPFEIAREKISVDEMKRIFLQDLDREKRLDFMAYVRGRSVAEMVAIFLGLLELVKARRVRVQQTDPFGSVEVYTWARTGAVA